MVCSVPVSTSPCSGSERSLSDPPPPYTVLDDKTPADQPQTPSISSSPKRARFSQVPGDTTSEASPSRSPSRGGQTDRLTFHVPEPLKEPPLGPASSVHLPIATLAPSYILAGTRRFAREDVEGFVNRPRQIHVPTAKPLFVYGTLMFPSILSAQARHSMQGNYSAQHQRRLYPESYDFAGANKSIQNATEIMTPAVLKGFDRWRPFGYDCAVVHQSEFTPQVIANGAAAGGAVPSRLLKGKVNGFLLFGITEEGLRCFDQLTSFKPSVTRGEERRQMRDFAGSIPIRSQGSPYLKFFEGVLLKRESVQVDISLEDGQTSSIEAVTYVWSGGSYGLKEPWNINKFVKTPSFGYWSLGSPNWVEEEEEIAKSLEISYVYPGDTLGNAALRENLEEVKTLLKQGDSVDAPCRNYGTALQISATLGNEEMARFLLKKGAKVDAEGGKYHSALVAATIRGHENLVTLLLDAKAKALKPAGRYISPLYQAISHSDEEIVYLLLEAGAWLDKGYAELLDLAAERGNRNIIDLMRDYDVRDLHQKLPSHADAHNPRGFRRRALNRSSKEVTTTNKSAAVLRAVVSQWLILKGTPGDWKGMKGVRTLKAAIKAGAPITVVDGIEKNLTGISSLIDYFKYSLERSEGGSLRFADSNRSLRDGRSHHDSESSEDSSEEDGSSSDDSYRRRKDRRRKRKPHSSSSTFLDMRDNNMEKNGDPGQQSRGRSRRTNGASSKPPYGKRPCSACSCFGGRRGTGHSCPDCRGQGYFAEGRYNRADSKNVSSRDIRCHACYGSGKLFSERDRCRGCAGRGWK
jgi:ankyrin repeat protein